MEETLARARCSDCGKGLKFEEWSKGGERCASCSRAARSGGPAAAFVRGPSRPAPAATPRAQIEAEYAAYERMLDEIPDELVDELVAALESEAERRQEAKSTPQEAFREVIEEIGFGRSPRELQWAAWGFAAGFALNVALAKYAQMTSGAAMSGFLAPLLLGGLVAGGACAAIGWGLARLRER